MEDQTNVRKRSSRCLVASSISLTFEMMKPVTSFHLQVLRQLKVKVSILSLYCRHMNGEFQMIHSDSMSNSWRYNLKISKNLESQTQTYSLDKRLAS